MILPLSVFSMMMALTDCRKSGCCSVVSCEFTVLSFPGGFSPPPPRNFLFRMYRMDRIDSMFFMCVASMIRTDVRVVKRGFEIVVDAAAGCGTKLAADSLGYREALIRAP